MGVPPHPGGNFRLSPRWLLWKPSTVILDGTNIGKHCIKVSVLFTIAVIVPCFHEGWTLPSSLFDTTQMCDARWFPRRDQTPTYECFHLVNPRCLYNKQQMKYISQTFQNSGSELWQWHAVLTVRKMRMRIHAFDTMNRSPEKLQWQQVQ